MNSSAKASLHASSINLALTAWDLCSHSVPMRPYSTFLKIVVLKRALSCWTKPIWLRHHLGSISLSNRPPTLMIPLRSQRTWDGVSYCLTNAIEENIAYQLVSLHVTIELVPSLQNADDCTFPGTRRTHNGSDFAGREREKQVVQDLHVRTLGVHKVDGLENNVFGGRDLGGLERSVRSLGGVYDGVEDGIGVGGLRCGL